MFDIASSHIVVVAAVALVVIGPKDLPRAMQVVGKWVGRARGMARHFRSGLDEIVRQAEIEEMQQKWAAENARIMAEHPQPPPEEADDAHHAARDGRSAGSDPIAHDWSAAGQADHHELDPRGPDQRHPDGQATDPALAPPPAPHLAPAEPRP